MQLHWQMFWRRSYTSKKPHKKQPMHFCTACKTIYVEKQNSTSSSLDKAGSYCYPGEIRQKFSLETFPLFLEFWNCCLRCLPLPHPTPPPWPRKIDNSDWHTLKTKQEICRICADSVSFCALYSWSLTNIRGQTNQNKEERRCFF